MLKKFLQSLKKEKKATTDGLTLVEGQSFEGIVSRLTSEELNFTVISKPHAIPTYFRDSEVRIHQRLWLPKWVGKGRYSCKDHQAWAHYAKYRIEPGFDPSVLDGRPKIEIGLLVERVRISSA